MPYDSTPPSRWSDEFLNSMRFVADSETDDLIADLFGRGDVADLLKLKPFLETWESSHHAGDSAGNPRFPGAANCVS